MASPQDEQLKIYEQISTSYRAIDDFRAKLLGFLPLATGAGIFLLLDKLKDIRNLPMETKSFLTAAGVFGFFITLGLFLYEIYGIKKCGALIRAGKRMENVLKYDGQFNHRPQNVIRLINEPFAAGFIYPTVMAAWMFIAIYFAWSLLAALVTAILVFVVGLACTIIYDFRLRMDTAEVIREDIKILYVSAKSSGFSPEVYNQQKLLLPDVNGRKFYGNFLYSDDICHTFVEKMDTDTVDASKQHSGTLPHGKYARRILKNWKKRTWEIPETFAALSKEYENKVDSSRPRIEFYKSEKVLLLFLPIL